ncbi:uncharacterized protein LOC142323896 [Lycorma delicatula]|uniref:uncharacterized protein LOC142323896 n=1 Tax=Lycorma delicatula TaxID=130591 RepID=UPI003F51254E
MDIEDDDDVHLCLRCRETIVGLEAYVSHRKSRNCRPAEVLTQDNVTAISRNVEGNVSTVNNQKNKIKKNNDNQIVDISINKSNINNSLRLENKSDPSLKADDFFSLLELQSSSKNPNCLSNLTSNITNSSSKNERNKLQYGIVTRSKSLAKAKEITKSNQLTKEIKEIDDNIEGTINKEVHDSSCSTFDESSVSISEKDSEVQSDLNKTGSESDLNNTNLKICNNIDLKKNNNNSNTDNCVALSSLSIDNANENISNYSQNQLKDSEDLEEENEEEEFEEDDDENYNPPRNHTGGKWKPGGNPSPGHSWRSEELWSCEQPPPTHTGGKWKPPLPSLPENKQPLSSQQEHEQQQQQQQDQLQQQNPHRYLHHPPPGHTRGKWMPIGDGCSGPTLRKAGNQVQYWCGVCNRRLSSRGIYERHLKSHLHAKRTRQERQLDEDLLTVPSRPSRLIKRRQESSSININKISSTKSESKRVRKSVVCQVCGARVWRHQMGKHLVSRFHCRRAEGHPSAGALILSYATAMARQAPFHCSLCRFYCNSMQYLIQHWDSKLHIVNDLKVTGRYWCSFCRYDCKLSSEMKCHLLSSTHQEVIAVINKSVPIVIQKLMLLKCPQPECDQVYRFNSQLRHHSRTTGHDLADCTACDAYQERTVCPHCCYIAHSRRRLNKHLSSRHNITTKYFCSDCGLKFCGKNEAKSHRRSKQHKYNSLKKLRDASELRRQCPYCTQILDDIPQLKIHLQQIHPEKKHRCIKCGASFTLKQELARHVRYQCKGIQVIDTLHADEDNVLVEGVGDVVDDDVWQNKCDDKWDSSVPTSLTNDNIKNTSQCSKCLFTSTSRTELLFHTALHSDPVLSLDEGTKPQNLVPKYVCPSCPRLFRKDCLKNHIKTHTGERPHACPECGSRFARSDVLNKHIRGVHHTSQAALLSASSSSSSSSLVGSTLQCDICGTSCSGQASLRRHMTCHHARPKSFLCAKCGAAFYDKSSLQQHIQIHSGKKVVCTEPGCVYKCRSVTELRYHLRTHSDQRPFSCEHCTYTAKTKAQLARHSKKHLGMAGREHRCQHCGFKGATSSHLRRHLRLHTGARPYHCPYCSYTCNLLENLRKHVLLTKKHPGRCLYTCNEENCQYTSNSNKDFRTHLVLEHNKNVSLAAAYVTGLYHSSEDPQNRETILAPTSRNNGDDRNQVQNVVTETANKNYLSNPTLASVANRQEDPISAVTVAEPSDEIIYIQLPSDDALDSYDSGVPFFSPADHFLCSSERPLFFENLPARTTTTNINLSDSVMLLPPTDTEREFIVISESTIELLPPQDGKKK